MVIENNSTFGGQTLCIVHRCGIIMLYTWNLHNKKKEGRKKRTVGIFDWSYNQIWSFYPEQFTLNYIKTTKDFLWLLITFSYLNSKEKDLQTSTILADINNYPPLFSFKDTMHTVKCISHKCIVQQIFTYSVPTWPHPIRDVEHPVIPEDFFSSFPGHQWKSLFWFLPSSFA